MDRPSDWQPHLPHIPETSRTSENHQISTKMSSAQSNTPEPTSEAPRPSTSSARLTRTPSSSIVRPTSATPTPTPSSTSEPPPPPSTSEPPPPPTSTETSEEPTSTSFSSTIPTTSFEPSTTSSIEALPTSSFPTSTTSPTPMSTLLPIHPGGLGNKATLGLAIGLPLAFLLVVVMATVHIVSKRMRVNRENKKRVQDIEEQANLAAFQAAMAQPHPNPKRRASAMWGVHESRLGETHTDGHGRGEGSYPLGGQRHQPYSRESGYRGW